MARPIATRELRELLRSAAFLAWHRRACELQQVVAGAREHKNELWRQSALVGCKAEQTQCAGDEALFRAAEYDDLAAQAEADLAEVENDAFQALSDYETLRVHASELFMDVSQREGRLEDERCHASEVRARAEAGRKNGTAEGRAEAERLEGRLREIEAGIAKAAREIDELRARLSKREERKTKLSGKEQAAWTEGFRATMARAEHAYRARRFRREAERLFAQAAVERRRVDDFNEEAAREDARSKEALAELEEHRERARTELGCILVEEFLYWPHADDVRSALCVPLIDEPQLFNIQLEALKVYQLERERGLEFVEPLASAAADDDDPRLEAFFGVAGERR